jgi:pimeloyl-ACP methyl ester carboxylesterase
MTKPSIVFAHGIWADGTCFQKLIPTLLAEGHEVMAAQYGLDTLRGDVDATIRTFERVNGPIVLVGHSYGGTVITHAGMDSRVAALVYTSRPWVRMRLRRRRANRTSSPRRTSSKN